MGEEATIRAVLSQQVSAWNRGDIDAFMETYMKSGALRFSSGASIQRGWEAARQRYITKYPNREAMGQLAFEDLEVRILSQNWAEAFGRYRLRRAEPYGDATGLFTLLLQRTEAGWLILHDHTSAGQ